ncbi:hypothetical protein ACFVU3_07935 [Streptomyces sp. NPDC058052]|uniref:hypothetical protein n=1 Tax=Streptomyces sp. NPDC058052 TaxID=3346316 RepID=UPI0036E9E4D3
MTLSPNLDLDEAAVFLRCSKRFLEDNLRRIPHQKLGRSVSFDEADLAEIKEMHRVRPATAAAPTTPVRALAQIRPKGATRVS